MHLLHSIGGYRHPWMLAFYPWMAGISMDGRKFDDPAIHLVAGVLHTTGGSQLSMDGRKFHRHRHTSRRDFYYQ